MKADRYYLYLALTIIGFFCGLIWLFFGHNLTHLYVPRSSVDEIYAFVSGIVMMLVMIAIYFMSRIVLSFTGLASDDESIRVAIYNNMIAEEGDGIFYKDRKGYYRMMNNVAKQLFDLEGRDITGRRDFQLFDTMLAHKIENEDRKIMQNRESVIWEMQKNTGQGDEVWLCKKLPCYNRKGHLLGILGYCRNITVLKTFQNLNTDLEKRYQNLFDKLPYPVLIMNALNLKPYSFNKAMNNLLGYKAHEFADMRFNAHLSEHEGEQFLTTVSRLLETSGGDFEARLYTRDKDAVDVAGYAQKLVIDDRIYLHMLLHDVTELKKSTEALIGSEVKYRSLFEHASDAILVVDIRTLRILDVNDVALQFLGYRRDDVMRMTLLELEAEGSQNETAEQLGNLEIYNHVNYEHVIRNRKGSAMHVEINAHKVSYGDHEVYQFVIRDISKRKQTELALRNSEQRYRQMFENNLAMKLVIDLDRYQIEDANPAAAEFYGYTQQEMAGMSLEQINILPREKVLNLMQQAREEHTTYYSCPHRLSSGDVRFVEVRDGFMEIAGKRMLYSIIHDVTESKRAEDRLLLASKMFDCTSDAVMITDTDNRIVSINQAFTDLTGYQLSEVLHNHADEYLAGRDQEIITEEVLDTLHARGSWQGEIRQRMKNGELAVCRSTINVVMNEQGEIINHIVMMSSLAGDVHKNASRYYNALTGLPNLELFSTQLKHAIDRGQRANRQVAVLLIDVRNFSAINHMHDRDVGDQILKAMARRLKHNVRESDTVAHFDKDDFAILIEDLADVQQTGIVAQKILSTLCETYQIENDVVTLEISIGISISPEDGVDEVQLLEKAEYALLLARQTPGSTFRLRSQHMNDTAWQWLHTEQNLHRALKNNEFVVSYLPQVNLAEGRIEAVEALVRWKTPVGNLLPMRFLPNAEQSGFISAIGNQVIELACADFGRWRNAGLKLDYIAFNLSQTQIDLDLEEFLLEQCAKYEIQPQEIMLDFNERYFIVSTTEQKNILRSLQEKGFRICVDDFGSANAALNCLLQCPVNVIKIDRAYTTTCADSIETQRLLEGIMAMATRLDMRVVAEGVETEEALACLNDLGCQHAQGYFFSSSLPADKLQRFVEEFEFTRVS